MLVDLFARIHKVITGLEEGKDDDYYANQPLLGSIIPVILIDLAYVAFVLKIGPDWMKNREAFNLKVVMLVYNGFQVVLSFYMALVGFWAGIVENPHDFRCIVSLPPDHRLRYLEISHFYMFYLVKYVDYLDTIFFVLRKNFQQITFLHVYHHLMMSLCIYMYLKDYGFGGHLTSVGMLNCFVHGFMYAYYFLSALRPEMKNSLWLKKFITKLQIVQFILIVAHQSYPLLFNTSCPFPKMWAAMGLAQGAIMLILFINFYIKAYVRKRPRANVMKKMKYETKMH